MKQNLLPNSIKKRRVAIVGFSSSRDRAPFDQAEWEIWGLNAIYKLFPEAPHWDRWFELHKRLVNLEDEGPEHIWKLAEMKCPIYMQEYYEDIPASVPYPLEKVTKAFRPYLTSTFSFMAALAILEGFQEIGVYGVDTADEEWGSQRPSLEYFLGIAEGRGIKVTIPAESSLLRAPFLYAYQEREDHEFFGKLLNLETWYEHKWKNAAYQRDKSSLDEARYSGAISAIKTLRQEWKLPFSGRDGDEREKEL